MTDHLKEGINKQWLKKEKATNKENSVRSLNGWDFHYSQKKHIPLIGLEWSVYSLS